MRARSSAAASKRSRSTSRSARRARSVSAPICSRRSRVRSPANQATAHGRPLWRGSIPGKVPCAAAVAPRYARSSPTTVAVVRRLQGVSRSRLAPSR